MATENRRQFQRRRTAAQWAAENPVLAAGEIGVVTGETWPQFKIGDGTTAWNSLNAVAIPARLEIVERDMTVAPGFNFESLLAVGEGRTITIDGASFYKGVVVAGTIVETGPFASGGRSFEESSIIVNPAGQAKTTPHHTGYYSAPTIRGDGALHTTDRTTFFDQPTYDVINAGTVSAQHRASFESALTAGSGVTVTLRRGLLVHDAGGAGTVTTQVGVDVEAFAKATTNIGIRNAATTVDTPSVATLTAVGNSIAANATVKRLDNTSGGSLTLTSAPTIADGQDGQRLLLFNSSANNVVLQDQGTLANSNLRLSATTITIGTRDSLELLFSLTVGDWIQIGNTNVL